MQNLKYYKTSKNIISILKKIGLLIVAIILGLVLYQIFKNMISSGWSSIFGMIQTALIYGIYYALLALGFALIFGAARVVNLYHGTFYMLGAYFFATFANTSHFNFPLTAFIIIQVLILIGLVFSILRFIKDKKIKKLTLTNKISTPVLILLFAQIPVILLFFKIHLPVGGNLNLIIALIISMGLIGIMSILINKYLINPVRSESVAVLIITLALALFTERLLNAIYGGSSIGVPSFIQGGAQPVQLLFGNTEDPKRILMFFIGIFLILFVWFLMNKTKIGKGVLAVAQDKEAAVLMGVNPGFVYSFAISLSAILAGLAGVFTAPFLGDASLDMWLGPLIKAFAIVILGGLGNIFGSIAAAFILAFVEKITKYYYSSSLEEIVFLIVIIAILIFRPQGLFGKKGRF